MGTRSPDSPDEHEARPRGRKAPPHSTGCKAQVGRGPLRRGTATLAGEELRFHTGRTGKEGTDFAVHLRYDEITALEADGPKGLLTVTTAEHGPIVFHLGRIAVKWKEIIEADRPDLLRDLDVGPKARVALVAIVDELLEQAFAARAEASPAEPVDVLFAGAEHRADLAQLPSLATRLRPGGFIWLVFAEGSRAITQDQIAAAARGAGLVTGRTVELSPGRLALRLSRA